MFFCRFSHLALSCLVLAGAAQAKTSFEVSYALPEKKPSETPIVYIALRADSKEPVKTLSSWYSPPYLLSAEDTDRDGKVTLTLDENSYLGLDGKLPNKPLKAQAIVRLTENWPVPGVGFDDLHSATIDVRFSEEEDHHYELTASRKAKPFKPVNKGRLRIDSFRSEKLSQFHERPTDMLYTLLLPENWDPEKRYPVLVYVHGYTGTYLNYWGIFSDLGTENLKDVITIIPDPNCRWGHHVFADSEVNGPWGAALTKELMPFIDKTYGGAGPEHRYVTGVSSGGWSSIWLQVKYPEHFAGCWGFGPDPLDFAHFQDSNFYEIKSFYYTEDGKPRPLSLPIMRGKSLYYKDMAAFERAIGPGGQLKSFAAVFSERLDDGSPRLFYDEATGEMDHDALKHWKQYEVSNLIKTQWADNKDQLSGKINVLVHEQDLFFLDHSVRAFEKTCQQIGCDAKFTYMEGQGHHIPEGQLDPMFKLMKKRIQENPALDRAK
ncbi:hypothetical protein Rhal01_03527 [Rubritalea halochordaticola]|uniref:Esterase n=1 Tax=Rubritalea halochordaticola TaxID=714537 RepID=A0ABP9V621_9BACT